MTKPKKVKDAEPEGRTGVPEKAEVTSVTVSWRGNERTYSKEIHGENFQKLAKQFADQYPDAVIS